MEVAERTEIRPQPGPQTATLSSPADIVVSGGAAGGGKTWGLILDPLRHAGNRNFGGIIFRRTSPQIEQEEGLWDQASKLYPLLGATPNVAKHVWTFPSGMRLRMSHLQHEKDVLSHQGAGYPFIGFDEITHFTAKQFWYMLSRLRSTAGVKPYIRATCNPDPDSFVADLVEWWIDPDSGYAIPERSGVIRWFLRIQDELLWADSREECIEAGRKASPGTPDKDLLPRSFTFIPSTLEDNPALTDADPSYRANLLAMSRVERERLLRGNWKIRPTAGNVFNRGWFKPLPALPTEGVWVRYWDKAGTDEEDNPGSAFTAGVLMGKLEDGRTVVGDVVRGQWGALERERVITQTAEADAVRFGGKRKFTIYTEQEPGSGGKESAERTIRMLAGYRVYADRVTGDKVERAQPLSAQAEAGNVYYVTGGEWVEPWLAELHSFPDGRRKDQADASSGAFNKLNEAPRPHDPGRWATVRG